jgi:hypothetical protein
MSKNHFAEKEFWCRGVLVFLFFFAVVGDYAIAFIALWDTTEMGFLRCGIQRKRFSSVVGYNGRDIPPLWDTTEEVFLH